MDKDNLIEGEKIICTSKGLTLTNFRIMYFERNSTRHKEEEIPINKITSIIENEDIIQWLMSLGIILLAILMALVFSKTGLIHNGIRIFLLIVGIIVIVLSFIIRVKKIEISSSSLKIKANNPSQEFMNHLSKQMYNVKLK